MPSSIETLGVDMEVFPRSPNYKMGIMNTVNAGLTTSILHSFGAVDIINDIDDKPLVVKAGFLMSDMAENFELLSFINNHRGRRKKFWLYTKINEFTLNQNISASNSYIYCYLNDYDKCYKTVDRVYLLLSNGDLIVRRVVQAIADEDNDEVTIEITPAMPAYEITTAEVIEIGRVLCCRFDIDTFEVKSYANGVSEISLRFLELPKEYPAT